MSATGNVQAGNIRTVGLISATGNVTGNFFIGNGSLLTGIVANAAGANTQIQFNSSNVLGASANLTFNSATSLLTVTGIVSATGNVQAGNVRTVGLMSATGNVTGGNITTAGLITATGNITGANAQVTSLGVGTPGSGTTGEIRATNNITAFYSSDAKYKENVAPIANAVAIASAIGGKTFDWTEQYVSEHGGEDGYFIRKGDFGVIAQDVQNVFPQAVRTRPDGSLAVDYAKLSALALAAIAELSNEIEKLKNR
jgi:hypothetical protein